MCHRFSLFHMFLLHYFCPRNSQLIGIIILRSHAIGKKTLSNNIFYNIFSLDEMKSFKFLKNNFSSQLSIQIIFKNYFKMFKSYFFISFRWTVEIKNCYSLNSQIKTIVITIIFHYYTWSQSSWFSHANPTSSEFLDISDFLPAKRISLILFPVLTSLPLTTDKKIHKEKGKKENQIRTKE